MNDKHEAINPTSNILGIQCIQKMSIFRMLHHKSKLRIPKGKAKTNAAK